MNADGTGEVQRLTRHAAADITPVYSPNGKKIAFTSNRGGNWDIFVMNTDGTGVVNLTNDPATDATPSWSPDGKRIVFASNRGPQMGIWVMNADGTGTAVVTRHAQTDYYPLWSPAGEEIAFFSTHPRTGNQGVFLMDTQGTVLNTMALIIPIEWSPSRLHFPAAWAPDGSKVAFADANTGTMMNGIYTSNRDGSNRTIVWEVPATSSQPPGGRIKYSVHIGSLAWSPDSKKIAFSSTHGGNEDVYTINSDGSGLLNITNAFGGDSMPSFAPVQ